MKRYELIATSKDTNCSTAELRNLLKDSIAEIEGSSIESDFETSDRAGEVEIAVGYLVGIASGLTVELIREIIREKLESRKLPVEIDVTEIENTPADDVEKSE